MAKLSPVEASALLLGHIAHAWNHAHPEAPLAQQEVVITVPASFDEAARALTVSAARRAGLEKFTLLEEPQAAFYDYTARHRKDLARVLESVVMPAAGLAEAVAYAWVDLSATGGLAVLELEPTVLFAVLARLSGAAAPSVPRLELTRLEEASFAFVGLSVLSVLRGQEELQREFSPRLVGVTMSRTDTLARLDARQRHLAVELTVTVDQQTARGRLLLPAKVLEGVWHSVPVERDETLAAEVLAARLPAFSLQPIVENAIKHGLEPSPEGGTLTVRADSRGGELLLSVSDTGCGTRGSSVTREASGGDSLLWLRR